MPFKIVRDDLAHVRADVLVIHANEYLVIDGGTALAVAKAAGLWRVRRACKKIGYCACGHAVTTPAFRLDARFLVHAVGPVWRGIAEDEELLYSAYASALECAVEQGCKSVALPLLSAGVRGCPVHVSLDIALLAIRAALEEHELDVVLALYDRKALAAGLKEYPDIQSFIDDIYVAEHHMPGYATERMFSSAPAAAQAPSQRFGAPPARQERADSGAAGRRFESPTKGDTGSFEALGLASEESEASYDEPEWDANVYETRQFNQYAAFPEDWPEDTAEAAKAPAPAMAAGSFGAAPASSPSLGSVSLEERLAQLDAGFRDTLFELIDESGMKDSDVYKRANMSRQHFAKIRKDPEYRPTKRTVFALAVALKLDLAATEDLLARAGYAFSHSSKFDVILEYFIVKGIFDSFEINKALYAFDQQLLG